MVVPHRFVDMNLVTPLVVCGVLTLVLTAARPDSISQDVDLPELRDSQLSIFLVTSHAPPPAVKASFRHTGSLRHSFKIVGEPTYIFMAKLTSLDEKRNLSFPASSSVTQYPVVHLSDYFQLFGVSGWQERDTNTTLHQDHLNFVTVDFVLPETMGKEEFREMMRTAGEATRAFHAKLNTILTYSVLGHFPPKMFVFENAQDNTLQSAAQHGFNAMGGPGETSTLKRIVHI